MKRRITVLLACALILTVIPVHVSAWGGYVAVQGSGIYHNIYCDELYGVEYSKLKWFDTKAGAEAAGLSPCHECNANDWYDYEHSDDSYFITNDHLLDAAFDAVLDYGSIVGYENGYLEGYGDCETEYEYSAHDRYNTGYDDRYDAGYNTGYDDGYSKGFMQAQYEAERQAEAEKEEMQQNRYGALFLVMVVVGISVVVNIIDKSKRRKR